VTPERTARAAAHDSTTASHEIGTSTIVTLEHAA